MRSFISEIISFRSRNPNEIFVPGSKQQGGGLFLPNEQVGEIKQEKFLQSQTDGIPANLHWIQKK